MDRSRTFTRAQLDPPASSAQPSCIAFNCFPFNRTSCSTCSTALVENPLLVEFDVIHLQIPAERK